jgi:hypothetical protein
MKQINNFFFLLGSVILPRIASITIKLLEEKNSSPLINNQRLIIYESENKLVVGKITPDAYLDQMCSLFNVFKTRDDLFIELMKLIQVDEGALSIIIGLMQTNQVYICSDYPRTWLQAIQHNLQLLNSFPPKNTVYTAELDLSQHLNSVFEKLMVAGLIEPGASLWVDAYPLRTTASIRLGIDAIIYVDERRLRRELSLRKLLDPGIN